MRKISFILTLISFALLISLSALPAQGSGGFGTCSNPIGAFILNYYAIDWTLDDGINTDCHELTDCLNPTYDAYYQFYLDSGPYIATFSNASGTSDSIYIGVMNTSCDTLFGEFCGLHTAFFNFGLYDTGFYTIVINTKSATPLIFNLVRGDITDEPYERQMEPCGVISGLDPPQMRNDSVFLGQWNQLEVWKINGEFRKFIRQ